MTSRSITWTAGIALALGGLALATPAAAQGSGSGRCPMARTEGPRAPLAEGLTEAVAEALQDEYQGEAIYARVLADHGEIRPFSNVVHAERRHASLLEGLLTSRELSVPANAWTDAEVPTYDSRQAACAAAIEFEVANVALYDRLLASEGLPEDIRQAFEHNRMASLDHHKPAFERCAAGGGRGRGAGMGRGHGRGCGGSGCGRSACGCEGGGEGGGGCGRGCRQGHGHGHGRGSGAAY